jgi:single-strand DNA-binding protein
MINNVVLVGRLTKDPEIRKTQTGLSVASFTIAANRPKKKDEEQKADFINCIAWRGTADFLGRYAKKGNLVGIEGRIQTRNYENQHGYTVYVTEILCNSVQLLESKKSNNDEPMENGIYSVDMEDMSIDLTSEELPF